jgi:hypothetical protein
MIKVYAYLHVNFAPGIVYGFGYGFVPDRNFVWVMYQGFIGDEVMRVVSS